MRPSPNSLSSNLPFPRALQYNFIYCTLKLYCTTLYLIFLADSSASAVGLDREKVVFVWKGREDTDLKFILCARRIKQLSWSWVKEPELRETVIQDNNYRNRTSVQGCLAKSSKHTKVPWHIHVFWIIGWLLLHVVTVALLHSGTSRQAMHKVGDPVS